MGYIFLDGSGEALSSTFTDVVLLILRKEVLSNGRRMFEVIDRMKRGNCGAGRRQARLQYARLEPSLIFI